MSECDTYKLIEEFIKKSSYLPNSLDAIDLENPTLLSIKNSEATSSSASFTSEETAIKNMPLLVDTPPQTPEQTISLPQQGSESSSSYQKPNRPYSYYVATNFHPLDLSLITAMEKEITVIENESKIELISNVIVNDKTVETNSKQKKKSKKKDDKKRLSMSLSDLKLSDLNSAEVKTKSSNCQTKSSIFELNTKKSKSNQNNLNKTQEDDTENDLNDDEYIDDDIFESSNVKRTVFKRSTFLTSTMPSRFKNKIKINNNSTNHNNSNNSGNGSGKLNKFFRILFRINNNDSKNIIKNEETIVEEDNHHSNFKFSRIFSFRHHNNTNLNRNKTQNDSENKNNPNIKYKYSLTTGLSTRGSTSTSNRTTSTSTNDTTGPNYQLIVTDEQPSKVLLPHIQLENMSSKTLDSNELIDSFNKMSSLDSLEILKDKFYSEVADRLKKLASNSNSTTTTAATTQYDSSNNEKSSLSSIDLIDIPFIDDDDESEDNLYSYPNSDYNPSTCSRLIKTDMSDLLIDTNRLNEFINNASYSKFDELAIDYLNKYDSIWNKIAVLFELINRAVGLICPQNEILALKLKEIAASYIHDKYCDWIYKNGGWKSVPDIISLPSETNERIH